MANYDPSPLGARLVFVALRVRDLEASTRFYREAVGIPREDAFDLRQDYVIDSSRIRLELGYSEIASEEEALRRTVDWERLNPPEPGSLPELDYEAEDKTLAALPRGGPEGC